MAVMKPIPERGAFPRAAAAPALLHFLGVDPGHQAAQPAADFFDRVVAARGGGWP